MNSTSDYIEKPRLPFPLRTKLELIFRELSSPELLAKCMHGQAQNNNESINGVIWMRCSKDTFVGRNVVEMSVPSAVISIMLQLGNWFIYRIVLLSFLMMPAKFVGRIKNHLHRLKNVGKHYDQLPKDALTMKLRRNLVTPVLISVCNENLQQRLFL